MQNYRDAASVLEISHLRDRYFFVQFFVSFLMISGVNPAA